MDNLPSKLVLSLFTIPILFINTLEVPVEVGSRYVEPFYPVLYGRAEMPQNAVLTQEANLLTLNPNEGILGGIGANKRQETDFSSILEKIHFWANYYEVN